MDFIKGKEKLLSIVIFVQTIVIIAMGAFIGIEKWQLYKAGKKKYSPPVVTVEAQPVRAMNFETFISAVGAVKSNETVTLRSQEGGFIKQIVFQSGSFVHKGDILVRFDDAVVNAQLDEAKARLFAAKTNFEREELLLKKEVTSKAAHDKAYAEFKMAEAAVATWKAKVALTVIKAPFDGLVGLKDVSAGAYIKPGEEIVTLDSVDPVIIDFRISETQHDRVSTGQSVDVEIDGFPDNIYTATIDAIDTQIEKMGHSLRVRASMPNPNNALKPGLFARVKFSGTVHENALVVPEGAVETEGNEEYVFAILDGVARRIPVKTAGRNGREVEITKGLAEGVMVVTAGQLRLSDGSPVIVVPEQKKTAYK